MRERQQQLGSQANSGGQTWSEQFRVSSRLDLAIAAPARRSVAIAKALQAQRIHIGVEPRLRLRQPAR